MNCNDDANEPVRDPMQEPYWTLAMMTAWVLWRNPQQVSEYWHINFERHGFPHAQSMNDVLGIAEYEERDQSKLDGSTDWPRLVVGAKEATIDIRRALAVLADGYSPSSTSRVSITLRDVEFFAIGAHADPHQSSAAKSKWHDAVFMIDAQEPFLAGVRVARSDVVKLWPDDPSAVAIDQGDVSDAGMDAVQPMNTLMEAEPMPQPAPTSELKSTSQIQTIVSETVIEFENEAELEIIESREKALLCVSNLIKEIKNDLEARIPRGSRLAPKRFEAMVYILKLAVTGGDPCRKRRDAQTEMNQIRNSGFKRPTYREAYKRIPPDLFEKYYERHS